MDVSSTEAKKPNLYLLFAGCIVLILLVIGYFTFFKSSAIPQTFFSKYREQHILVSETFPAMQFNYGLLGEQIQAQNASAAANLAKEALVQSLKNKENEKKITTKTTELKLLLAAISDTTIKEKIVVLFGLLDERNQKMKTIIETQIGIFTQLRNNFGAIAVGEKGTGIPQNIDTVIGESQKEVQALGQIQTKIDVAFEEIVKLSGVDITVSSTADSIKSSLSGTPVPNDPFITDFPTPTLAPTTVPLPTDPVASDSADIATPSAPLP